ncbi:hypothetical protein G6F31_018723 [Rhizopus arrhizus]|nr:hypothetical protein G6F31_018723 [Rhizopus arrhizus]
MVPPNPSCPRLDPERDARLPHRQRRLTHGSPRAADPVDRHRVLAAGGGVSLPRVVERGRSIGPSGLFTGDCGRRYRRTGPPVAAGPVPGRIARVVPGAAVRLPGAGQPVASGLHGAPDARPLAGPVVGDDLLSARRPGVLRGVLVLSGAGGGGRPTNDVLRQPLEFKGKTVYAKVLDLHLR